MSLFDTIVTLLKQKEDLAIATIINRSGSAPRDVGTRMLIRKDATIVGTVGGGILEARVQQLAERVLAERTPVVESFKLNLEDVSNMGMTCGGSVRVMIQYVDASDPFHLQLYQAVDQARKTRSKSWLVTPVPQEAPLPPFFIPAGGPALAKEMAEPWTTISPLSSRPTVVVHNGVELLIEPLNSDGIVYVFGAGHISQKLAPLTQRVGFYTIILDDRKTFANRERFASADEIRVLRQFQSALDPYTIDEDSYLVIVTRGHSHDKTILAQALKSSAGYIGMIGSRRKRDDIYTALKSEGFTEADLTRVYSPIGLNIYAETPEEIAVSIVAELIQQRARKRA